MNVYWLSNPPGCCNPMGGWLAHWWVSWLINLTFVCLGFCHKQFIKWPLITKSLVSCVDFAQKTFNCHLGNWGRGFWKTNPPLGNSQNLPLSHQKCAFGANFLVGAPILAKPQGAWHPQFAGWSLVSFYGIWNAPWGHMLEFWGLAQAGLCCIFF